MINAKRLSNIALYRSLNAGDKNEFSIHFKATGRLFSNRCIYPFNCFELSSSFKPKVSRCFLASLSFFFFIQLTATNWREFVPKHL